RVFDSSGHEVASKAYGFNNTLIYTAASTGIYYVGVSGGNNLSYDPTASNSGSEGAAFGAYTLTLSFTQAHDTLGTAIPFPASGLASGNLTFNDQVDLYSFQSPGD